MKTLFKLAVAVMVLNAVVRLGWAAWNFYELRDAAQQAVTFGAQEQPPEIHGRILKKAGELRLPVNPDGVVVQREGVRTHAAARYVQPVEVFPRYSYPLSFAFDVEAVSLTGLK
jgi:hypothetical protein